jgi:hypothetical protein
MKQSRGTSRSRRRIQRKGLIEALRIAAGKSIAAIASHTVTALLAGWLVHVGGSDCGLLPLLSAWHTAAALHLSSIDAEITLVDLEILRS